MVTHVGLLMMIMKKMMMMIFCHKFGHKRGIFLPHGFLFLQRLIFIRLTICVVLWISFSMWFLPARRRIKAHRLVSWTCVLSFKSLTQTSPCLLCSPRSPKRSLFIRFPDKDCVQYTFRISSLHATCCASPSPIWSPLAPIFASVWILKLPIMQFLPGFYIFSCPDPNTLTSLLLSRSSVPALL